MARVALAVYLIAVTLAGPGFCTCRARIVTPARPTTTVEQPAEPQTARKCRCCSRQQSEPSPAAPSDGGQPRPAKRPANPFCPCDECRTVSAPARDAEPPAEWLDVERAFHTALGSIAPCPMPADRPITGGSSLAFDDPHKHRQTARDILRALAALRC